MPPCHLHLTSILPKLQCSLDTYNLGSFPRTSCQTSTFRLEWTRRTRLLPKFPMATAPCDSDYICFGCSLFYKKPVNACIVKYFICLHFIFQWESNQHAFYLILFKNLIMETAHVSLWTVRGFWILKYFSELKQEHRKHADSTSPNQDWHYCGQTNFDRNPCQLSIHHPLMLFWVMNSLELHFEKVFFYCTVYRRTIKWWESAAVVTEKKNIQDWIEVL